jgi:hypothetical protein
MACSFANGEITTEADVRDPDAVPFPRNPESAAAAAAARGVRVSVIRLAPSVHGKGENHGFVPRVIALAREHGVSAYVGDGNNRGLASTAAIRRGSTVSPSNAPRSTPCITRLPTRAYRSAR